MRRHVGIFAGTFNPVHAGHLAFVLAATDTCHLDQVIFIPEQAPRSKSNVANIDIRAEQLNSALVDYSNFSVMVLDDRNLTVAKTLPQLNRLFPNTDLTLLIGSDVALQLKEWGLVHQLLKTCYLAIGLRSQHSTIEVRHAMEDLQTFVSFPVRYKFIKASHANVSSSQLR